jgi:hypothetical protein
MKREAQALRLSKDDTSLIASLTQGEAEGVLVSAAGTGHCSLDSTKLDPKVPLTPPKMFLHHILHTMRQLLRM